MVKPAASSPARLMRSPDDNRSMFLESLEPVEFKLRVAEMAATLLLIRVMLIIVSSVILVDQQSLPAERSLSFLEREVYEV
jgi:hypothetical protein